MRLVKAEDIVFVVQGFVSIEAKDEDFFLVYVKKEELFLLDDALKESIDSGKDTFFDESYQKLKDDIQAILGNKKMKVKELIQELKKCDPEATVVQNHPCDEWLEVKCVQKKFATYEEEDVNEDKGYFHVPNVFEFFHPCNKNDEHAEKVVLLT